MLFRIFVLLQIAISWIVGLVVDIGICVIPVDVVERAAIHQFQKVIIYRTAIHYVVNNDWIDVRIRLWIDWPHIHVVNRLGLDIIIRGWAWFYYQNGINNHRLWLYWLRFSGLGLHRLCNRLTWSIL